MTIYLVSIAIGVLALAVAVRFMHAYLKFRGERVITCPENSRPAGVRVDARHVAAMSLGGAPELRLSSCTRWPEKANCGQACLAQIQDSPEGCLIRNIVARWLQGKACASCGRAFGEIDWTGAKPGLLTSSGISLEWQQVPADRLTVVLESSLPLCFACHMANRLVREHADLAIDRGRPALQIKIKGSCLRETVDT